SLGVVMFQLHEGRLPFQALTPLALLKKHESEPPPPLSGAVPEGVQELLDRCLAKDPADRYQTPAELVQAITALRQPASQAPAATVEPAGTPARLAGTPAPSQPLVAAGERVSLNMSPLGIIINGCPGARIFLQPLTVETDTTGLTRVAYAVQVPRVEGLQCE